MIRFLFFPALLLLATPVSAQSLTTKSGQEGEILGRPVCSWLTNRSDQTIMGTLATAPQTLPDGGVARHRENFRLNSGDRRQFCVAGPFYEGQRLELTLRTIIPLFTCKTKIDREIFLDAKEDENGNKKLSATCY